MNAFHQADTLDHAIERLNQGDIDAAMTLFAQAASQGADADTVAFGEAICLGRLGKIDEAVGSVEKALRRFPGHAPSMRLREELHSAQQQAHGALSTTATKPFSSPSAEDAETGLASALLESGREFLKRNELDNAADLLAKAKGRRTPIRNLDRTRATVFLCQGKLLDAVSALREELNHFTDNEEARTELDALLKQYPQIRETKVEDPEFRELYQVVGRYTMVPESRLYSLYRLAKHVCESDLPGQFVECGVAAGGSTALIATVLQRYSRRQRLLYAFDSFEGMPDPGEYDVVSFTQAAANASGWGAGTCAAPESSVREVCETLGVWGHVRTVKGLFEDTLPRLRDEIGQIAFLHMDGDWYSSTKAILDNLYDLLVPKAVVQVDDFGHWMGCRKAFEEFVGRRNLTIEMKQIDVAGVWFHKV